MPHISAEKIPNGKLQTLPLQGWHVPVSQLLALSLQWPAWAPSTFQGGLLPTPSPRKVKGNLFFFSASFLFFSFFLFFFPLPVIVEPLRREFMCVIICVVIGSLAYESLTKLTEVSFGEKCNQLLHSDTLHQINSCCLYGFGLSCPMVSFPKTQGRRPRTEKGQKPQGWRFLSQEKVIYSSCYPKSSKITNKIRPILRD